MAGVRGKTVGKNSWVGVELFRYEVGNEPQKGWYSKFNGKSKSIFCMVTRLKNAYQYS